MDDRNFAYMFYGFAAAWLILVAYVVALVAREGRIQKSIDTLKRMLQDRG